MSRCADGLASRRNCQVMRDHGLCKRPDTPLPPADPKPRGVTITDSGRAPFPATIETRR
jgi:hypothetical protein